MLFEDKTAIGVEYQSNPKFLANPEFELRGYASPRSIKARKQVIISTGACVTPLVLERSGIGNAEILRKAGVEVIEDLPGVGHDYQDHHLSLWSYRTSLAPRECINGFTDGRFDVGRAIAENDELLGTNAMEARKSLIMRGSVSRYVLTNPFYVEGKVRPTEKEVEALGPEFKAAWDKDFKEQKDRPLMIMALYNCYYGDHSVLPDGAEYVSLANWTAYPYSRGHVHITGPKMNDETDFDTGWLKDPNDVDVKKHIWAYKVGREVFRRMAHFRGELKGNHPNFPEGSKAAIVEQADGPIAKGDERITYTEADDKAIEQKVRETVSTTWGKLYA